MKITISVFKILILLVIYSCTNQLEQHVKLDYSLEPFDRKIDSIIVEKINRYNIPGLSVGVVESDSILFLKGYGLKSIKTKKKVNKRSIFHTASISKLFTAQAVLILIQKNKTKLEDKLIAIIPELKYSDKRVEQVTIKSLLNHTSGLPDVDNYNWENNSQADYILREYVLSLDLKLRSDPHEAYNYSNLGYDILGYVIEKRSGMNFEEFVKDNILIPSQMLDSDFRYFKIEDSMKTSPHSKTMIINTVYKRKIYPYTREHAPSSTLNSSAHDLSKWMISFLNSSDSLGSNTNFESMYKPSFSPFTHIGLGFQLSQLNGEKIIGHFGGDKGYRSYLIMVPEKRIGLVLLANCDYDEDFRQEILHPILNLILMKHGTAM